jgi:hypothetical protein
LVQNYLDINIDENLNTKSLSSNYFYQISCRQ